MSKTTLVIEFNDEADKTNFLWIMNSIKFGGADYRMPTLFIGLMNSILRDIVSTKRES